ncbi:MAG: AmmeMemoRadiSam system radical SAM enzyme [Planctomycetaceae bacterium]|nr:MAG: AmmeMemoRadiSam system radical SAM enzyme [Planctomycetaceae bacterium]
MLWTAADGLKVKCELCGHRCQIAAGKYGICRVRENVAGQLKTLNYKALVALNVDPIEKKPLFHFLPGTKSLSIAAPGCNFQCEFCQNWQISQSPRTGGILGDAVSPAQIVTAAVNYDCPSISYTYTEPTVFFELAYDTCKLAKERGLRNCFVSNGFLSPLAVRTIAPYLDAINVDLKAFRDETCRRVMKASLAPVLESLKEIVRAGIWLEVTTLVVPGMNDSPEELRDIATFISRELGTAVPWHVSRFHGDYKMAGTPGTPVETIEMACRAGLDAGLLYVYGGNCPGQTDERTRCPDCKELLIDRWGFTIRGVNLRDGACPKCSRKIEGIWGLAGK